LMIGIGLSWPAWGQPGSGQGCGMGGQGHSGTN
jgi:hypothetical protein